MSAARIARLAANPAAGAEYLRKAEAAAAGAAIVRPTRPEGWEGIELEDREDGRFVGQCPACLAEGRDMQGGNHLVVFADGRFGCILHPGDEGREHRREIARLVGLRRTGGNLPPLPQRDLSAERAALKAASAALWVAVLRAYSGGIETLGESREIPEFGGGQFEEFVRLFEAGDRVWAGGLYDQAPDFARHAFVAGESDPTAVHAMVVREALEFTFGVSWKPEATNRTAAGVAARRFLVVEHDKVGIEGQIALIRYAVSLGGKLRAVLRTGGKGLHGWFDAGSLNAVQIASLTQLGADAQSLNRSATRIPGAIRGNGNRQELVWLAPTGGTK